MCGDDATSFRITLTTYFLAAVAPEYFVTSYSGNVRNIEMSVSLHLSVRLHIS